MIAMSNEECGNDRKILTNVKKLLTKL
jgi:hypothetical protein